MTKPSSIPPAISLRAALAALAVAAPLACGGTQPAGGGGATTGHADPGTITRSQNPGLCAPAGAFSYALCTCQDFTDAGLFIVGRGPSGDGSVGINGRSTLVNADQVAGSWVSFGGWS